MAGKSQQEELERADHILIKVKKQKVRDARQGSVHFLLTQARVLRTQSHPTQN